MAVCYINYSDKQFPFWHSLEWSSLPSVFSTHFSLFKISIVKTPKQFEKSKENILINIIL